MRKRFRTSKSQIAKIDRKLDDSIKSHGELRSMPEMDEAVNKARAELRRWQMEGFKTTNLGEISRQQTSQWKRIKSDMQFVKDMKVVTEKVAKANKAGKKIPSAVSKLPWP